MPYKKFWNAYQKCAEFKQQSTEYRKGLTQNSIATEILILVKIRNINYLEGIGDSSFKMKNSNNFKRFTMEILQFSILSPYFIINTNFPRLLSYTSIFNIVPPVD